MCRAPKSLYMVEAVRKMKFFLTFVFILNLLMPVNNVCACTTPSGAAKTQEILEIKEKDMGSIKTSNTCNVKDIFAAVMTAAGMIISFYILGKHLNPINVKVEPVDVNINQDDSIDEKPGWFQNTFSSIKNFFEGYEAAPPIE